MTPEPWHWTGQTQGNGAGQSPLGRRKLLASYGVMWFQNDVASPLLEWTDEASNSDNMISPENGVQSYLETLRKRGAKREQSHSGLALFGLEGMAGSGDMVGSYGSPDS